MDWSLLVHTLSYKGMRPFYFNGLGNQVSILGAVSIPLLAIPSRIVRGPAQIVIKNLPRSVHVTTQLFGKPRFHSRLKGFPLWLISLFIYQVHNYTDKRRTEHSIVCVS